MPIYTFVIFVVAAYNLPGIFVQDAKAQNPAPIVRVIKALSTPPHANSVLKELTRTPLGKTLSATVIKDAWPTNKEFQLEALMQLNQQDGKALEGLIADTGQFQEFELRQVMNEINALAHEQAVEVRSVDSVEFLRTYERITQVQGSKACSLTSEICVATDKTMAFSFSCGGAHVQLTTSGQLLLTAPLPNGKKYSVPLIGEP